MSSSIHLRELHKRLGDAAVLESLTLTVAPGEVVAVIGPSGCGKSTLLNVIAGLLAPDRGELAVEPGAVIGYVFQQPRLLPWRTALRNVEFALEQRRSPTGAKGRARALEALELVGLAEAAERLPSELSGGMQQRVALARALAPAPGVLLLDEPFASVDALTRTDLQEELAAIVRRTRTTVVLVTHDIDESLLLADRVAVMSASPARIRSIVDVPFGPERSIDELVADPRFAKLRADVRGLLPKTPERGGRTLLRRMA